MSLVSPFIIITVVQSLREHLSEIDEQVYSSALTVSTLQRRRDNLSQAVEVLQVNYSHLSTEM